MYQKLGLGFSYGLDIGKLAFEGSYCGNLHLLIVCDVALQNINFVSQGLMCEVK